MAKDARGHGSDSRGGGGGFSADQAANLKAVLSSRYQDGAHPGGAGAPQRDAWSSTPGGDREVSDTQAAGALSNGNPKSAPPPVHDAWSNTPGGDRNPDPKWQWSTDKASGQRVGYRPVGRSAPDFSGKIDGREG